MTAYVVVGVVGLVILGLSLLAGDILDGAFDAVSGDWFSSAVVGGFVSAFGFGAATAVAVSLPGPIVVLVGVAAGVLFGWFAAWLTRLLRTGRSDDTVQPADTVGHSGVVLTNIPDGGFGVVRVRIGGHVLQLNARADAEVPAGAEVYVTGVLSPTAVTVAPV